MAHRVLLAAQGLPACRVRAGPSTQNSVGCGHKERGAAIITAMLVMTLAAILVAGLIWRADVQMRRVESQRLSDQAQWIERGTIDWARVILRSTADAAPTVDYPGQAWSVPIAQTRLSDFLTQIGAVRAEEGAATYLSGNIEDMQARFNLHNLVTNAVPGISTVNPTAVTAYARLLSLLGLDPGLARLTAEQLHRTVATLNSSLNNGTVTGTPAVLASAGVAAQGGNVPLMAEGIDQLLDVPGYTPAVIAAIAPFVTILPVATPVNANTTSAQVLAAVVPGLPLSAAQAAVAARGQAYFRNTGDLSNVLRASGITSADVSGLDVRSHFFVVHAHVQHERAEINRDTLLYRTGVIPNSTMVIATRDAL